MTAPRLRPRRFYLRPTEQYVGFGRSIPEQPDLLEVEFRLGWRVLVVCRVCLIAERERLQSELDRLRHLALGASKNVAGGIAALEQRIAKHAPKD